MPYVLRIDSSSRHAESHSRRLADRIEARLLSGASGLDVRRRDLSDDPVPHISDETIAGFYTPPGAMTPQARDATALSDALIEELKGADTLLLSAPMYNFGVPSALKAWIDQVVRINETFAYDESGFSGLVPVRRAFVATAYGAAGYGQGGAFAAMNFLDPYLVSLLTFLGIQDVRVIRVESTTADEDSVAGAWAAADRAIADAFPAAA